MQLFAAPHLKDLQLLDPLTAQSVGVSLHPTQIEDAYMNHEFSDVTSV